MNRIERNIKKNTLDARNAGFLKLRKNIEKYPLNEIEILSLRDYLAMKINDSAKNSAWTLAFSIDPREDLLSISEKICNKLHKIKDENIEASGISNAAWYFLKKHPEKLDWIIKKSDKSESLKLKEIIANIAFYIDQFQGVRQWAKLYAYAKERYHPWAPFEMDLYHSGSEKLLRNIREEIKNIKLNKIFDEKITDVYSFFGNVVSDGLKSKNFESQPDSSCEDTNKKSE